MDADSEMYLVSIALRPMLSVSSRVDNVIGMHRGRVTQSGMWRFDWSEEGFIVHLSSAHSDARHFTAYTRSRCKSNQIAVAAAAAEKGCRAGGLR